MTLAAKRQCVGWTGENVVQSVSFFFYCFGSIIVLLCILQQYIVYPFEEHSTFVCVSACDILKKETSKQLQHLSSVIPHCHPIPSAHSGCYETLGSKKGNRLRTIPVRVEEVGKKEKGLLCRGVLLGYEGWCVRWLQLPASLCVLCCPFLTNKSADIFDAVSIVRWLRIVEA